ncbi:MAG: EFR1 family ferrodoxin [Candidatus Hodarchaeota archaeon]
MKITRSNVVYFSPNGTTRQLGEKFNEELENSGIHSNLINLTGHSIDEIKELASKIENEVELLLIGSPVYAHHPPRAIIDFIRKLPVLDQTLAIIFVTYGAVSAGSAIRDIAKELKEKNLKIYHGIKFIARHSMIFDSDKDKLAERPGKKEFGLVNEFTKQLLKDVDEKTKVEDLDLLEIGDLPPQSVKGKAVAASMSTSMIPAPKYHIDRCVFCGKCIDNCSMKALSIIDDEKIVRNKECSKCFNCVRTCPNNAWTSNFVKLLLKLHDSKTKNIDESRLNKVY